MAQEQVCMAQDSGAISSLLEQGKQAPGNHIKPTEWFSGFKGCVEHE